MWVKAIVNFTNYIGGEEKAGSENWISYLFNCELYPDNWWRQWPGSEELFSVLLISVLYKTIM